MKFVESIQAEGVVLERKPMGEGTQPKTPLVVEVDKENEKKDMDALDIEIPVLTPRVYREYKNLGGLFKRLLDSKLLVVYSHLMVKPTWTTLEQAIERSRSEILGDVVEGTVPATCASYSELHDYVDANGYGGAFEHDFNNEETDFWNAVQDAVDTWIKAGGLKV